MRSSALLALLVLLTAALRIHTFPIPLERDEGEYAYAGQLMLDGVAPYDIAYNMKLPGTYAAHALNMAIFGQTIGGVHAGLLIWNAIAILLIFAIGRRLFGDTGGLVSAASYAWRSLAPDTMGTASHATQYVVPCAMAGVLFLLRAEGTAGLAAPFFSGVCFGLAFLMKQHGVLFGVFGALYLAWSDRARWRQMAARLGAFGVGALLPFALTCLILWRAGVFARFWFWTFTYASAYASQVRLGAGFLNLTSNLQPIVLDAPALWALAAVGFALVWLNKKSGRLAGFLTAFLAFSFLAMCPGLLFREHYFVLVLPAVALLAGAAVTFAPERLKQPWPAVVFVALLGVSVAQQFEFFFQETPIQQSRDIWGDNPFPEAIQVARYIQQHSKPSARIAVIGSEPEIYFYAHRKSATGYIYTYALMELQPYAERMQGEMISEIMNARPEYCVWVSTGSSWARRPGSLTGIFDWWTNYWPGRYDVVGVADIVDESNTVYKWDAEAPGYKPQSENYITVLKRRI